MAKADKATGDSPAKASALETTERLLPLGEVTNKPMFGGYGIFIDRKMFVLVDKAGTIYLKCNETNEERFIEAGSEKFRSMPYRLVPEHVWQDDDLLLDWAQGSVHIALS